MSFLHYPVMNREVVAIFHESPRSLFVDCTVGLGGHASEILKNIAGSRIIAVDEDGDSLEEARRNLAAFANRVSFHQGNFLRLFDDFRAEWSEIGGVLVDPGLSMGQLSDGSRGFSHSHEGPLDMRKDRRQKLTAAEVVNGFAEKELADIFSFYGEVKNHREVAKRIIEKRLFSPIASTGQLRRLVEEIYHWRPRRGTLHPAAKVFQALRIFINRELEGLTDWIRRLPQVLKAGTRLIFLSYHSLEDRLVKQTLRELQKGNRLAFLRPYPRFPGEDEIQLNPPSRSARMRAAVLP